MSQTVKVGSSAPANFSSLKPKESGLLPSLRCCRCDGIFSEASGEKGYVEDTWRIRGGYVEDTWRIRGGYVEDTWRIRGGYVEDTWRIRGGYVEDTWRIRGGYVEDTWRIRGRKRGTARNGRFLLPNELPTQLVEDVRGGVPKRICLHLELLP
ncbi:hypothetical protein [Geoanaerobacter pelophilus]|uniref:hypothetical protein n=1 Tax=Geoanaerobacter pelophilus TaxID=60036 RepID=UPI00117BC5D1|nr:hypothetical protein [Geoanaerobacter pelophilus]